MRDIKVFGYYKKNNLGDDQYVLTIPKLFPGCNLEFLSLEEDFDVFMNSVIDNKTVLVFGGGDLINDYFLPKIEKICKKFNMLKKIGLSLGIPYPELIPRLNIFDEVYVRNTTDLLLISRYLGTERVHYLPDTSFFLDIPLRKKIRKNSIGIFPIPSLDKHSYIKDIRIFIKKCIKNGFDITLYRFDSGLDDDLNVIKKLSENLKVKIDSNVYTPNEMLKIINKLSFAVCFRFHAHIFCTLTNTPFISISTTRKTELYMKENRLEKYLYSLENKFSPISSLATLEINVSEIIKNYPSNILVEISERNKLLLNTQQVKKRLKYKRKDSVFPITLLEPTFIPHLIKKIKKLLDGKLSVEKIAQILIYDITNSADNDYHWGTVQNLISLEVKYDEKKLFDMIDWIIKDVLEKYQKNNPINVNYINQYSHKDVHRSGWDYVIKGLLSLNGTTGILCDTFVDRTFHWNEEFLLKYGIIPYTSPWVGFIHHTPFQNYTDYDTEKLFNKISFLQSLSVCKGLYVLSENLSVWLRKKLEKYPNIPVYVLTHPTEFPLIRYNGIKSQTPKKLISIGAWYRNPFAIFSLDLPKGNVINKKIALKGKNMENYFPPKFLKIRELDTPLEKNKEKTFLSFLEGFFHLSKEKRNPPCICRSNSDNKWLIGLAHWISQNFSEEKQRHIILITEPKFVTGKKTEYTKRISKAIKKLISEVEILPFVNNDEYDRLLSHNVVFVNLLDASAVNTVIECIVRNTPIVINNLPAIEEPLGASYPLYYEKLEDVCKILTEQRIYEAYDYLSKLNKDNLRLETFLRKFCDSIKK